MENVFAKPSKHGVFSWDNLGDIKEGRADLGDDMPVLVYRLMQFTMLDVLSKELGPEKADELFYKAGFLAGTQFAANVLDMTVDMSKFIADLTAALENLKIGILRMESLNADTGDITLTVEQDLDCSGLPVTGEMVCNYDEGFISGLLKAYTGQDYTVKEINCWSNGDRVCRFNGKVE